MVIFCQEDKISFLSKQAWKEFTWSKYFHYSILSHLFPLLLHNFTFTFFLAIKLERCIANKLFFSSRKMLNLNVNNWKISNSKVWLYWLRVFWNHAILIFQSEIDQQVGCHGAPTTLSHKKDLKWISAAIHETIRLTCSPIVPHVATQNSTIGGKIGLPTQKAISVYPFLIV